MSVSRRKFLQRGALAAAACTTAPIYGWTGHKPAIDSAHIHNFNAHKLTRPAFENVVGSSFKVSPITGKGAVVWMRLASVEDLPALAPVNVGAMAVPPPPTHSTTTTSGFMLSFQAPGTNLRQGTYAFEHAGLGTFDLLIVPGRRGHGTYTAVFNQIV